MYINHWNIDGQQREIASRMNRNGIERKMRYELETKGPRALGCNIKLTKGIEEKYWVDFFMAVFRRQIYAEEYKLLQDYVNLRIQNLKYGDKSVHPVIDANIEMFIADGYSGNAISEATSLSISAINRRAQEVEKPNKRFGQVIEMLPDIRMFDPKKYVLDEPVEKTGPSITNEQRKFIQQLRDKGYTPAMIQRKTGFHPETIKKWCKARNIE